jgi:hypothetical protein
MKWNLGGYDVKYNPKENGKSWNAQNQITINMNGEVSNPNLNYNGTQKFTIDIYDKPTYANNTANINGAYIAISEKRTTERMFLLKSTNAFDVKSKDGVTTYGTYTITGTASVVLPPTNPTSMIHIDTEVAFIYKESTKSTIVITDENGVANRKYIYSTDDIASAEHISWDNGSSLYMLNPYGKIYTVDKTTGTYTFLYQFDDYSYNSSLTKKKYTGIIHIKKAGKYYIGVLQDKSDIVFLDKITLEIVCKTETRKSNIVNLCYSDYSDNFFMLLGQKVLQFYPNTARIDVEYLKSIIANGQITIYDEMNIPSVLSVKDMSVLRKRNTNEAMYEVSINADIAYTNIGFSDTWGNL